VGLYLVGGWILPRLQALAESSASAKPSLIVTSGVLHNDPWPSFFSLSVAKTAQRNLVDTFRRVYNSQGVNVGLVCIGAPVSLENKVLNPTNIAKVTWDFFDQETAKEKLEVEIYES
jgi:NAD(P)-dependent dehydrogenase (short-subunit alcohol dehydrogenase family)